MKKYFCLLIFSIFVIFITGCGIKRADDVIGDFEKKLEKVDSYYTEGVMQIINNEDTYDYEVKVSYKRDDYYKIELVNTLNNHEQVILRNDDGVYVVTPSLNKSFKFQSDWPYNNSQVYLLNSILEDLKEDEKRTFETVDDGYVFTSKVNYPNNKNLTKQNVYMNKDSKITKVEVVDKENNTLISMTYNKIEYNKKFDDDCFDLNSIIKLNDEDDSKSNNQDIDNTKASDDSVDNKNASDTTKESNGLDASLNSDTDTTNNNLDTNNDKVANDNDNNDDTGNNKSSMETASINDVIYPMYLPDNTYLTNQERVRTTDGERLILTFGGDDSFTLVEETISVSDSNIVIPVSGEFDFLSDVIGVIGTNLVMWHSNGIEYYMTSNTLKTSELVDIARSISVLPVSK